MMRAVEQAATAAVADGRGEVGQGELWADSDARTAGQDRIERRIAGNEDVL
jgi:hypothetical protein